MSNNLNSDPNPTVSFGLSELHAVPELHVDNAENNRNSVSSSVAPSGSRAKLKKSFIKTASHIFSSSSPNPNLTLSSNDFLSDTDLDIKSVSSTDNSKFDKSNDNSSTNIVRHPSTITLATTLSRSMKAATSTPSKKKQHQQHGFFTTSSSQEASSNSQTLNNNQSHRKSSLFFNKLAKKDLHLHDNSNANNDMISVRSHQPRLFSPENENQLLKLRASSSTSLTSLNIDHNNSSKANNAHHHSKRHLFGFPSARLKSISSDRHASVSQNLDNNNTNNCNNDVNTGATSSIPSPSTENPKKELNSLFDIELSTDSMAEIVNLPESSKVRSDSSFQSPFPKNTRSSSLQVDRNNLSRSSNASIKNLRNHSYVENNGSNNSDFYSLTSFQSKDNVFPPFQKQKNLSSKKNWKAPESWAVKSDIYQFSKNGTTDSGVDANNDVIDDNNNSNNFFGSSNSKMFNVGASDSNGSSASDVGIDYEDNADPLEHISDRSTDLHKKLSVSPVSPTPNSGNYVAPISSSSSTSALNKSFSKLVQNNSSNTMTSRRNIGNEIHFDNYQMRSKSELSVPVLNSYANYIRNNHEIPDILKTLNSLSGNYTIKVFREDNTFTTIFTSIHTSVAELLVICKKKFFLTNPANYQIVFKIGKSSKILDPEEQPLQIQSLMLLLLGYDDKRDNLHIIGREDITYLCKFVLEENDFSQPIIEDEEKNFLNTKDFSLVNLENLALHTVPLIFYQHSFEIEQLNVNSNPSIFLPGDFIASCNNLRKISFSSNRANKFPISLLEAKKLTRLDVSLNLIRIVPERLGNLTFLNRLFLNGNNISMLPDTFGNLKNLKILNLSSNNLVDFPEAITKLENLLLLDLSFNQIKCIPEKITNLQNLDELNLATNCLQGTLPEYFSKLSKMKVLYIQYNNLTNFDSAGLMENLEVLYASKNNVSRFKFQSKKLRVFLFDRNPIIEIPFNNINFEALTTLNLSKAKLTSLSNEDLLRLSNIEVLILDKNDLTYLPSQIGSLKTLNYLSSYANNLQSIPESIGQLTNLQHLDLHLNSIKSIPNSIWNCSLTRLNLSSNLLTNFPVHPRSNKSSLTSTNLDNTRKSTSGNSDKSDIDSIDERKKSIVQYRKNSSIIADPIQNLSDLSVSLQFLAIADNRLSDDCFEAVSMFSELKVLNFSYNELIDIPPGILKRFPKLIELYLSGNDLNNLPAEDFVSMKYLKILHINANKIHSLPHDLSKIKTLAILDAGSNQLKYNIFNYQYDWNWQWNHELKYLNFSGNKRLEISKQYNSHPTNAIIDNKVFENVRFDSFTSLSKLKVLGLIDVTLRNSESSLPDESVNTRVRTTASDMYNYKYGIADSLGTRDNISIREVMYQNFTSSDDILLCVFDGKNDTLLSHGNRITYLVQEVFQKSFSQELAKILNSENTIEDCLRRTFLNLNREINNCWLQSEIFKTASMTALNYSLDTFKLDDEDILTGSCITVVYIKGTELYAANIGDSMGLLSKTNGEHELLTEKHDPTSREEFERIRLSGGYVSSKGELDSVTNVSRAVGFLKLLPHINAKPFIKKISLTMHHEMLVIATSELWEYINYEIAVDVITQHRKDPMLAAQKLRDFAISYGAKDNIVVIVLTLNARKRSGLRQLNGNYSGPASLNDRTSRLSITEDSLIPIKKRKDRLYDSNLNRLENEIPPPVGAVAMVFTDIKNSTLLWDNYLSAMRSAIKTHNSIMRRQLRIVGGYEVKTEGDAFMVSFPTPISALIWCINVQLQLLSADWPLEILESSQCCEISDSKNTLIYRGLSVRMGIHWGFPVSEPDAITGRMDYFGPMVNRASRVSSVADGGQISISSDYLKEFNKLLTIHEEVTTESKSLKEAYGDVQIGAILEGEMETLESIGYIVEKLGEKKLKGLETPEFISLVFPNQLTERVDFIARSPEEALVGAEKLTTDHNGKVASGAFGGLIHYNNLFELEVIAVKLEHICAVMSGSSLNPEIISIEDRQRAKENLLKVLKNSNIRQDVQYILFLENVITRIENCATTIQLNQLIRQSAISNDTNANSTTTINELLSGLDFSVLINVLSRERPKVTHS